MRLLSSRSQIKIFENGICKCKEEFIRVWFSNPLLFSTLLKVICLANFLIYHNANFTIIDIMGIICITS